MEALILKDTFIDGNHVPQGTIADVEENTFALLTENKKAVALKDATTEQKKLIKTAKAAKE